MLIVLEKPNQAADNLEELDHELDQDELDELDDLDQEESYGHELEETPAKFYTVSEFLEMDMDQEEFENYELIGGRLVAKPKSGLSFEHGNMVVNISTLLNNFAGPLAGEKQRGWVLSSTATHLGKPEGSNYVMPDVCFVAKERLTERPKTDLPIAPDLVVEVISPNDTNRVVHEKTQEYLANGVKVVWLVYLLQQYILTYTLNEPNAPAFSNIEGEIDGGEVLPDFKLTVATLFQ